MAGRRWHARPLLLGFVAILTIAVTSVDARCDPCRSAQFTITGEPGGVWLLGSAGALQVVVSGGDLRIQLPAAPLAQAVHVFKLSQ